MTEGRGRVPKKDRKGRVYEDAEKKDALTRLSATGSWHDFLFVFFPVITRLDRVIQVAKLLLY